MKKQKVMMPPVSGLNLLTKIALVIITGLFISNCTEKKIVRKSTINEYVCYKKEKLKLKNTDHFAQCFDLDVSDLKNAQLYQLSAVKAKTVTTDELIKNSKNSLKRNIANSLQSKMEKKFKTASYHNWDLDKTSLPVHYAVFYSNSKYRVYAAISKDDITVVSLLKYLPLEYKLPFLKKLKIEYKK